MADGLISATVTRFEDVTMYHCLIKTSDFFFNVLIYLPQIEWIIVIILWYKLCISYNSIAIIKHR